MENSNKKPRNSFEFLALKTSKKAVFTRIFMKLLVDLMDAQREVRNAQKLFGEDDDDNEVFHNALCTLEDCKQRLYIVGDSMMNVDEILKKIRGKK